MTLLKLGENEEQVYFTDAEEAEDATVSVLFNRQPKAGWHVIVNEIGKGSLPSFYTRKTPSEETAHWFLDKFRYEYNWIESQREEHIREDEKHP